MLRKLQAESYLIAARRGHAVIPGWKEANHQPPCNDHLEEKRIKVAKFLSVEAARRNQPGLFDASDDLFDCRPADPCGKVSCPACDGWMQRFFWSRFQEVHRKDLANGKHWSMVTIVPSGSRCWPGDLSSLGPEGGKAKVERMWRRLENVLETAKVSTVKGALDITFNADCRPKEALKTLRQPTQAFGEHWRPHMHLLIPTMDVARAKPMLREEFRRTSLINKPVRSEVYDGRPEGVAYTFKRLADPDAMLRREAYVSVSEATGRNCGNSRGQLLRAPHRNELLVFLNQLEPWERHYQWQLPSPQ